MATDVNFCNSHRDELVLLHWPNGHIQTVTLISATTRWIRYHTPDGWTGKVDPTYLLDVSVI